MSTSVSSNLVMATALLRSTRLQWLFFVRAAIAVLLSFRGGDLLTFDKSVGYFCWMST